MCGIKSAADSAKMNFCFFRPGVDGSQEEKNWVVLFVGDISDWPFAMDEMFDGGKWPYR